jgi:hypothetical protein
MAMMAMGMTGINPSLRRRNSMDITAMQVRESGREGKGGEGRAREDDHAPHSRPLSLPRPAQEIRSLYGNEKPKGMINPMHGKANSADR